MTVPHQARKSLGQNFLVDANQQRRIVAALEAGPTDTVLEIGPGRGALTSHLAGAVERLVLVELDDVLAAALEERYRDVPGVTVVHADFMKLDLRALIAEPRRIRVVGNIPYNITTPIIFRLLEPEIRPALIVLMIQREVADRIVASAGTAEYGALSVGVRTVARVERLFHVSRNSFRPVPRVDSTVIRMEPLDPPPLSPQEERELRELTRITFAWRRKQLQRTLRSSPACALDSEQVEALERATGIGLAQRPEDLEPGDFIRLAAALRDMGATPRPQAGQP